MENKKEHVFKLEEGEHTRNCRVFMWHFRFQFCLPLAGNLHAKHLPNLHTVSQSF
jgi:hypothetical protein